MELDPTPPTSASYARTPAVDPGPPTTVVSAGGGRMLPRVAVLWRARELLYFLIWRDVKVRYKQTLLGVAWAILQPLLTAVVFTLFFGRVAGVSSDGVPYPVFAYAGLLLWTFVAGGVTQAAASLVGATNLVTKVYFPREMVPAAAVLAGLVDLVIAAPLLVAMMLYYGLAPGPRAVAALAAVALAVATALGVGLVLAAANALYRDVRYTVPFVVQLWLFVSPVIYPVSTIAPRIERIGLPPALLGINPVAGAVETLRWAVLGTPAPNWPLVATSTAVAVAILVAGLLYFHAVERVLADVV